MELRRNYEEIYYYKSIKSECDFVVSTQGKITKAIQVSYDMSDSSTRQREIKGLVEACRNFDLKVATIVTYDSEDEFEMDSIEITAVPFYKWAIKIRKWYSKSG